MIDIEAEELLTLSQAARRLPNGRAGKPVHIATLHRWAGPTGLRGNRLETVKIGGVRYTSAESLTRFIEACNSDEATGTLTKTTKQRQRAHEKAERELDRVGI